jgi:hypothetical protein
MSKVRTEHLLFLGGDPEQGAGALLGEGAARSAAILRALSGGVGDVCAAVEAVRDQARDDRRQGAVDWRMVGGRPIPC